MAEIIKIQDGSTDVLPVGAESGIGYTRFPNGTQMCYGYVNVSQSGNAVIEFPKPFYDDAYGISVSYETTGGNVPGSIGPMKLFSFSESQTSATIAGDMPSAFVGRLRLSYIAIGRWK